MLSTAIIIVKKLFIIYSMILAASQIVLTLDLLLIEMTISNTALIKRTDVGFFSFLFSQIKTSGKKNGAGKQERVIRS